MKVTLTVDLLLLFQSRYFDMMTELPEPPAVPVLVLAVAIPGGGPVTSAAAVLLKHVI